MVAIKDFDIIQNNGRAYVALPAERGEPRKYLVVSPVRTSPERQRFVENTTIGQLANRAIAAYLSNSNASAKGAEDVCKWHPRGMKPLGAGAYGVVYKVCSCPTCDDCKVYKIEKDHDCGKYLEQMILNNNAVADAGMAPRIIDHNICNGQCKYTMEFVDGKQLWDVLRTPVAPGGLAERTAFIDYLFENVEKMHRILPHGHGDLSPANMMYTKTNQVTFIDFAVNFCDYNERHFVFDYCQLLWYLIGDVNINPQLYEYIIRKLLGIIRKGYNLPPKTQKALDNVFDNIAAAFEEHGEKLRRSRDIEAIRNGILNFAFYCKF